VFSSCRESGDHGPFNSWDRQPYLTTVRTGEPSMIMQWREIHHNFFIDNYSPQVLSLCLLSVSLCVSVCLLNYSPQENVDNDDGSCFYHTHDNFLVYGGNGMKNDFGGHDNHHYSNIYAYAGRALGVTNTLEGHVDLFQNNTVVLTGNNVGGPQCKAPATIMGMNKYYTKGGTIKECGTQVLSLCLLSVSLCVSSLCLTVSLCVPLSLKGIDKTIDPGSTVADLPTGALSLCLLSVSPLCVSLCLLSVSHCVSLCLSVSDATIIGWATAKLSIKGHTL
jgi:hypothetical protein